MDDVFGSDGESDREDLDPQNGQKITSTPHDILNIDEDDDKNDPEPAKQPSLKEETRDIFGSDDDDEQELELDGENETITEKAANPDIFVRKSQDDDAERDDLFGSDDDEEGDSNGNSNNFLSDNTMKKSTSTAPSHSKLCLPNIHRLSDGSQMLLKMPGFVKFQPRPYNPSTYDPEAEASLFNHAPDIIRWRYQLNSKGEIMKDVQGAPLRESNSRLVKWSDGTYQFLIGEETFEGQLVPVNDSFIYAQQYSAPPKDTESSQEDSSSQSDIKKGSVLECVGTITNKLNVIVSSVTSVTHERMSLKTNEQYRKAIKIKTRVDNVMNPEKESEARIGAINEQLKRERKRALQIQSDQYGSRGSGGYSSRASMSAAYMQEGFEDDRNYDSVSIKSIKRGESGNSKKFGSNKKSINLEDEDDEEDDEEDGDPAEMSGFIVNSDDDGDDDEEEEGEYVDEEGDDEDEGSEGEDDEEEEQEEGKGSKKQKPKPPKSGSSSQKKKASKVFQEKKSLPKKSCRREEEDSGDDFAAPPQKKKKSAVAAPVTEEDETGESQQKKRLKRTIVDSDDDSS